MHDYDIALKAVLRHAGKDTLSRLTGFAIERWHNAELPSVRSRHADLLGEAAAGQLVHIELQSANDRSMALRMAEYALAIFRYFGRFPAQVVLYVGQPALRMNPRLIGPHIDFACRIVDLRELDAEPLLASPRLEDNVFAILTRFGDERAAVRRILESISRSDPAARSAALAELLILAGLRKLGTVIEREARQMPILDDILDHEVLGREYKRGMEHGREEGFQRELSIVLRMIEKRFGTLPAPVRERVAKLSGSELEELALRVLDAGSLEELLG